MVMGIGIHSGVHILGVLTGFMVIHTTIICLVITDITEHIIKMIFHTEKTVISLITKVEEEVLIIL